MRLVRFEKAWHSSTCRHLTMHLFHSIGRDPFNEFYCQLLYEKKPGVQMEDPAC